MFGRVDIALKSILGGNWKLQESGTGLRFGYAKTKKQLNRNICVNRAEDMIKRDALAQGKNVKAEWKHEAKGKRTVEVNGVSAFLQVASDVCGTFLPPFSHLHF